MAGLGWGVAPLLLYPPSSLTHQVALVFITGGMMLGASSLLAPRHEAFLAYLIPAGLGASGRLLLQGDETHLVMGFLAAIFSAAIIATTYRISATIESSLFLQFEKRELVGDLLSAQAQREALNQALERRVEERTGELRETAERLRAEIAQRRQVEDELLRARKLESLGVLAGGIAHDFNNFLAVVQGNTELVKTRLPPDSPAQTHLTQTLEACRRATFLSGQLLTFAKGGAPVRQVVSVAKLVTDAVCLARAGAPITISTEIDREVRPVRADPGQIGQVLQSILLNARQSMPHGGIVEVRAENCVGAKGPYAGQYVRISIRDFGCGIAPENLPRIFDPYFTTKREGAGLGLATAYAIVAKHGGQISVESKEGAGSIFVIDLPSCEDVSESAPSAAEPVSTTYSGKGRILIMDDEEAIRSLLAEVLKELGYQVETARDGAEAIAGFEDARASGRGFDAVVLDLTVSGGMGGVEAAAKLKELEPGVKLIVSSGYADAPVMSEYATYGFEDVIPKPWTSRIVSEVFRKVLTASPQSRREP